MPYSFKRSNNDVIMAMLEWDNEQNNRLVKTSPFVSRQNELSFFKNSIEDFYLTDYTVKELSWTTTNCEKDWAIRFNTLSRCCVVRIDYSNSTFSCESTLPAPHIWSVFTPNPKFKSRYKDVQCLCLTSISGNRFGLRTSITRFTQAAFSEILSVIVESFPNNAVSISNVHYFKRRG